MIGDLFANDWMVRVDGRYVDVLYLNDLLGVAILSADELDLSEKGLHLQEEQMQRSTFSNFTFICPARRCAHAGFLYPSLNSALKTVFNPQFYFKFFEIKLFFSLSYCKKLEQQPIHVYML